MTVIPPMHRSIISPRFGMVLPERQDKVLVDVLRAAFLKLDSDAANLRTDNVFDGTVEAANYDVTSMTTQAGTPDLVFGLMSGQKRLQVWTRDAVTGIPTGGSVGQVLTRGAGNTLAWTTIAQQWSLAGGYLDPVGSPHVRVPQLTSTGAASVGSTLTVGTTGSFGGRVTANEVSVSGNRVFWANNTVWLSRENWGQGEILECNRAIAGIGWQVYHTNQTLNAICDMDGNQRNAGDIIANTVVPSLRTDKTDISVLEPAWALARVRDARVRPTLFRWKHRPAHQHIGLIADDVAEVMPDAAAHDTSDLLNGYESAGVVAVLWGAVQQLALEVDHLKGTPA